MSDIPASTTHLTYGTVISTLAFAGSVIYGIWALNQAQVVELKSQIELLRRQGEISDSRITSELSRREVEIKTRLDDELIRRRAEFVAQPEFKQSEANTTVQFDLIRKQLGVLEQTRPTTGELQAASRNSQDTAAKLEDRVRALEQYLLGQSKIFNPTK